MTQLPTAQDAQRSLREHVFAKASEAKVRRGGCALDRAMMMSLLEDRSVVRYPLGVRFDQEPLKQGEFACLEQLGEHPSDGFCLSIHPMFEPVNDLIPLLIAYYIPSVNYGDVATHIEAEIFGATLLGFDVEEYYKILCSVADTVSGEWTGAVNSPAGIVTQ